MLIKPTFLAQQVQPLFASPLPHYCTNALSALDCGHLCTHCCLLAVSTPHPAPCCTDIINSQLRAREIDVAEAQRVAAAAQAEVSVLRSQLAAAKQAAAAEAAGAEARLAAKEAEVCGLPGTGAYGAAAA